MASERVVLLPGDGIGPEVAEEARLVLELVAPELELEERLIGGEDAITQVNAMGLVLGRRQQELPQLQQSRIEVERARLGETASATPRPL